MWQSLQLGSSICKIGLELLYSGGIELIGKLALRGVPVFVDAKLYDIGNTVARATARIADLGATFLTVHSQDRLTVEAAIRGRSGAALKLLGITLLTNARPESLSEQGIALTPNALVLQRASLAAEAGFDGVVASPWEVRNLKEEFGKEFLAVCPGIRPEALRVLGDDQARTATPRDALIAGADYLVVGRPILTASDPPAAARSVVLEMADALRSLGAGTDSNAGSRIL